MLKLRVFSIQDAKVGVFMTPFFSMHLGQGIRTFQDLCSDPQSALSRHPSDFVLYEVGEFDTDKATLIPHNPIRQVMTALEVAHKNQQPQLSPSL